MIKLLILILILQVATSRIPIEQRLFTSVAVDKNIQEVSEFIQNSELKLLFENTFPNTLDTTVSNHTIDEEGNSDTYVITGDINAMWLRDSSNQMLTYQDLYTKDPKLQQMVKGVINRQLNYVLLDPFANAFYYQPGNSEWRSDQTYRNFLGVQIQNMLPMVHERKFEIDSITSVLRLQNVYYEKTQDTSIFDINHFKCLRNILNVFRDMQRDQNEEYETSKIPYFFERNTQEPFDTISHGQGAPTKHTGLIRTFFRPSDDATVFQFNIPINAFASATMRDASEQLTSISSDKKIPYLIRLLSGLYSTIAGDFAEEVREAIYTHGLSLTKDYFLYEVDGYGNGYFMDDANHPSLLSMPLFGFVDQMDQLYQNTRRRVLSHHNPFYFHGTSGSGIGGPHVGINYVWPMSIITQGLTSSDSMEVAECLSTLRKSTGGTYFIHESFQKDNSDDFTRKWFAWANGLFGQFVNKVYQEMPELLREEMPELIQNKMKKKVNYLKQ